MFKFLKEKLGSVLKKFTKEVEKESEKVEAPVETKPEPVLQKKAEIKTLERKPVEKAEPKKEIKQEHAREEPKKTEPPIPKKEEPKKIEHPISRREEPEKEEKHKHIHKEHEIKREEHKKTEQHISKTKEPEIHQENKKETPPKIEEKASEQKKGFLSGIFGKKKEEPKQEIAKEEKKPEPQKEIEEEIEKSTGKEDMGLSEAKPMLRPMSETIEKKGFFSKVSETFTKFHLSEDKFEEIFWDLEVALLESNVAVEVIERIKKDLRQELTTTKISRKNPDEIISERLTKTITEILSVEPLDFDKEIKRKKPYIIAVIGVNGSGKTTTIAKLVHRIQKNGLSVVLAAADTFRAAAIQQLESHAEKLGVKLIKHDYNSDPAAVAFDAVRHAEAKGIDVVIIDTAGRLHSNDNLMNELRKLIKVNKPDMKLFVGESITGNDCVEQAKVYNEQVGIDAIILSKADIDEKGGAALSISYITQKPVIFLGTGQTYDDLKEFSVAYILKNLGLEA